MKTTDKLEATIEGVSLKLAHPDVVDMKWIGNERVREQLVAAWLVVAPEDVPLNPRLVGKPGVGKTTLAYSVAKDMGREVFIMQCTMDTRPEDLIVTPVIAEKGKIAYHASPLVTAMIRGGVCILDEGNRMSEKSWASLAPLLDRRRYVESVIAGIKIVAHPEFRICVTMNDDASTYDLPEYIQSRLQPQVEVTFPSRDEEFDILRFNVSFAQEDVLAYVADFLYKAHQIALPFTSRDGVSILRYAIKLGKLRDKPPASLLVESIEAILGEAGVAFIDGSAAPGTAAWDAAHDLGLYDDDEDISMESDDEDDSGDDKAF